MPIPATHRNARRDLARKMHEVARTHAVRNQQVYRATVIRPRPLTVKLATLAVTLGSEDFQITHTVAQFIARYGLADGDAVLMVDDGDWLMVEVLDHVEKDHVDTVRIGAAGSVPLHTTDGGTWHYKGTLAAYDRNGRLIGRIPLI